MWFFKALKFFSRKLSILMLIFSCLLELQAQSWSLMCKMVWGLWENIRFEFFLGVLLCKPSPFLFKWTSVYSRRGKWATDGCYRCHKQELHFEHLSLQGKMAYQPKPFMSATKAESHVVISCVYKSKQTTTTTKKPIQVRNKSIHASF